MKKTILVLLVFLSLLLIGCDSQQNSPVTTVEFLDKNVDLKIGESRVLELVGVPDNISLTKIEIRSSVIETVIIDGIAVTGASEGSCVLTAYYKDEALAQCAIRVTHIEPERIWLENEIIEGKIGRTIDFNVESFPANITDTTFIVEVEDNQIATVDNGVLLGVGEGTTDVSIRHSTTGLEWKGKVSVTQVVAESIEIVGKQTLSDGEKMELNVVFVPEDVTDKTIVWKTSNDSIANIDNSVLYAHGAGVITITASTSSGTTAEKEIEITPVLPKSLSLKSDKGEKMIVNDVATLSATILPDNTTDKRIVWNSSDSSIATVNEYGVVSCLSPGIVQISATLSNGISKSLTLTVNPKPVAAQNGFLISPKGKCEAPVTVHASKTASCYVYFKNDSNSDNDFSIFVSKGDTAKVEAPLGNYTMYYASGDTWYGTDYKFGVGTSYYKADSNFKFYTSGLYVYGTEVTLYTVVGGNMEVTKINEWEFPG